MFASQKRFSKRRTTPVIDLQKDKPLPYYPVLRTEEYNKNVNASSVLQKSESKSVSKDDGIQFLASVEDFCSSTSLHGLRYVGDPTVSYGERLYWVCSFIGALCFAIYFINSVYTNYNDSPTIISLNPSLVSLTSLPFPAVTICSTNQAKKKEAEEILRSGTEAEKLLLNDYCNLNSSYLNLIEVSDEAMKWETLQKFILRVNPTIHETIKVCMWKEKEMSCDDLFNNVLTDDGLCYTFNALPRSIVFRNPSSMTTLNLTYPPHVDDWNPEKGYSANATINTVPWRSPGPGANLGLSVVLDAHTNNYFCSSVAGVGFKILVHNPLETPKMADYSLLAPPGFETRISIDPKISDATPALSSVDIQKRRCYFAHEKILTFYRTYTEVNCQLECQANHTLTSCGCVDFYLPKNRYTKICDKNNDQCAKVAKAEMEMASENRTRCSCLPACFDLGYEATATYGKLSNQFKVRAEIIKRESPDYFMTDMTVIHFYFVDAQFTRNTKSVIYGFSEFLSNTGGLLGLFMGFSFLSAVELAYHLSLRILCKVIRSKHKKKSTRNMKASKK